MGGRNRIERTSVARTPAPELPFWRQPWFQRVAVAVGSTALALSCPLLPWPGAKIACNIVVTALHAGVGELPAPPSPLLFPESSDDAGR